MHDSKIFAIKNVNKKQAEIDIQSGIVSPTENIQISEVTSPVEKISLSDNEDRQDAIRCEETGENELIESKAKTTENKEISKIDIIVEVEIEENKICKENI